MTAADDAVLRSGEDGVMCAASDPVHRHLEALDEALTGPRREKASLLTEVADHLEDASRAYASAGLTAQEARARAVADLGTVEELAPEYRTTLAVASSRRTAGLLLVAVGLQPFLWDGGLRLGEVGHAAAPAGLPQLLDGVIELVGAGVILGTLAILFLTGLGSRWFRVGRGAARIAAVLALAGAMLLLPSALVMVAVSPGTTPVLWALVVTLMVLPVATAGWSATRTLAAC